MFIQLKLHHLITKIKMEFHQISQKFLWCCKLLLIGNFNHRPEHKEEIFSFTKTVK